MYIATGMGQTTLEDRILMSTETSRHFGHLLQLSKTSLWCLILYIFFFIILYMYIAPGQGLTTQWGRNFDVNRKIMSLRSFVASLKKNLFEVWFYTFFFHDFIHVYSPGAGADSLQRQSFDVSRNVLSLHSLVQVWKNVFEDWFYTFFSWFNTCI